MNPNEDYENKINWEARFWKWVDIKLPEECWNWKLAKEGEYGGFSIRRKSTGVFRSIRSHRASWILHFGFIPEGLSVLHTCDNKRCVNPNHLFLGTQADNVEDMMKKGRHNPTPGFSGKNHSEETKERMGEIVRFRTSFQGNMEQAKR